MQSDESLARSFRALSHPRRIRLLRLLQANPRLGQQMSVLQRAAKMPDTSFKHHIAEMQRAGLISKRREGAPVRLAITPVSLAVAIDNIDRLIHRRR